jgi:hypothetical protein
MDATWKQPNESSSPAGVLFYTIISGTTLHILLLNTSQADGGTLFELCRNTPVLPINSVKVFGKAQTPMIKSHRHNPRVPMGSSFRIGLVEDAVVLQGPDRNTRGRGNTMVVFSMKFKDCFRLDSFPKSVSCHTTSQLLHAPLVSA